MTDRIIPDTVDFTESRESWAPLTAFLATLKTGDVVHCPREGARILCDKPLNFPHVGVKFDWDGATFIQTNERPFGADRLGDVLSDGRHFTIQGRVLPPTCAYGYVDGPGITPGTEVMLDNSRKSGVFTGKPATPAKNVPMQFTSKQDRGRCGFNITGREVSHAYFSWEGPNHDWKNVDNLEAQHGVNLDGARDTVLTEPQIRNMFGDGMYLTGDTTFTEWNGGVIDYNGRSAVTPVDCSDTEVRGVMIDHVKRTVVDIEPPDPTDKMDRFSMNHCDIGTHQLTLISSGGQVDAHVGVLDFSDNIVRDAPMVLWLVVGDSMHKRGPYTINRNTSLDPEAFGGTYPTAALIAIANAVGYEVTGNTGIKLQPRFPQMAVVRARASGHGLVSGNQFTGGIEVGSWV